MRGVRHLHGGVELRSGKGNKRSSFSFPLELEGLPDTAKPQVRVNILPGLDATGYESHPEVSWDLVGFGGSFRSLTKKQKLAVGRQAMDKVAKSLEAYAAKHNTSAFLFTPTSESRARLYKGAAERAGADYELSDLSGSRKLNHQHMLVKKPPVYKDILEGLAVTSPFGAFALSQTEEGQEFLQPEEKTPSGRKPVDFIRQTVDR